ncbi:hypothetical protein L208DRAFT_739268 [Tricholoma matsutake]|nr:hypothetical protein L208DRAFT_739268 [Tricholoma matsutake 945]
MGVDVDVDDVDDNIIPGCYALNIDVEGLELSKIWIRADYIRVYNSLDSLRDVTTASIFQRVGAILTGEPGIGKSVWCVMRYADALQEGSQSSGFKSSSLHSSGHLTLVDSDEASEGVPPHLVPHDTRLFIVYSTPPRKKRLSRLHKTIRDITVIMNPRTRTEISYA